MKHRSEISLHEVRIYLAFLHSPEAWMTNHEVSAAAAVAGRTARLHTMRMARLGVLDQLQAYPGHRYRLSAKGPKRNPAYCQRLSRAVEVFGLSGQAQL